MYVTFDYCIPKTAVYFFCTCSNLARKTPPKLHVPTEAQLGADANQPGESLQWFWKIDDMWKFDNVGFTKAVPGADGQPKNYKFVVCGSCDRGIMGIQHIGTGDDNIYVATGRVLYH